MPYEIQNRIASELRKDERLVRAGQPDPKRFARMAIPIMIFGIPFTAFAIFWMVAASGIMFGAGNMGFGALFACFPLFGIPFLLTGLTMLSSPIWMKRRAKKTCYALTDQRAIIWAVERFSGIVVRSYQASELGKMVRREYANGTGDLIFEEIVTLHTSSNNGSRLRTTERGFIAVPHVRDVEDLLRSTLLTDR